MSCKVVKISILLFLLLSVAGLTQDHVLHTMDEDSSAAEKVSSDSVRYYRPPPPKKLKSYSFHMTEYMMKANMARLSHYARGRYLNPLYTVEDIFIQANRFPEEVKNKMFALAIAGGAAREIFRRTRKQLHKYKVKFIYPNLYGLNIVYPVRRLDMNLHFRAISVVDRYYLLSLKRGQYYFTYRETPIVRQNGFYYRFYKRMRLIALYTQYRHTIYNGFGLSHSTKKLFFYAMYTHNRNAPQYSRINLYVNVDLN